MYVSFPNKSKNVHIFKGIEKCFTLIKRSWMYKKMCFLLTFFVLTIIAWTNYRLVTKHVISITHFHTSFLFFSYFSMKILFIQKNKLSNKDYLLLIYTFMGMIQFWRSVQLSFKSHKMCTFSPGLGMARNRDGLSWNDFFFSTYLKL